MKKSLSAISATVLAVSCLPFTGTGTDAAYAAADGTAAAVRFYMEVEKSDKIEIKDDGTIYIDPEKLTEDISLTANIYFSDPQKGAWSVSPKWKSSDKNVTITKVNDPFETPTEPFAYSVKGEDGKLSVDSMTSNYSVNSEYNSHNFTVRSQDGKALIPYGSTSDAYPLITFEFVIDADTNDGRYDIYFTDDADNSTRCAMDAEHGNTIYSFPDCPPDVTGLTIYIGERRPGIDEGGADFLLGDVNEDGKVDSADASLVLAEYGLIQTGGTLTFTDKQKKAADVNKDGKSDSSDASKILEYYGAVSTGKIPSWD